MPNTIFQIKISLKGSKPNIWRRILIPSDLLLLDFHQIIQTTMGWTNSHLHQFIKNKSFYSAPQGNDDDMWSAMDGIDYKKKKIKVSDLLKAEKEKIAYEYDFGDSWEHTITLEKILPFDNKTKYPICIAGKMNCPPEDCGGAWNYANMLNELKQTEHEENEDSGGFLNEDFDPVYFDKDEINELLQKEDYGCYEL